MLAFLCQRLDRCLAILSRVTDVVFAGRGDVREPLSDCLHDVVGVVHRQRRLRDHGNPLGVVELDPGNVLDRFHQMNAVGRVPQRAVDFYMSSVSDQQDFISLLRVA